MFPLLPAFAHARVCLLDFREIFQMPVCYMRKTTSPITDASTFIKGAVSFSKTGGGFTQEKIKRCGTIRAAL